MVANSSQRRPSFALVLAFHSCIFLGCFQFVCLRRFVRFFCRLPPPVLSPDILTEEVFWVIH
jgi:hypothetical protein